MQHDSQLTLLILFVSPALIDNGLLALTIREGHVPHPKSDIALNKSRTRTGGDLTPTLQAKPAILRELLVMADKVGERTLPCGSKSLLAACHGRFK